MTGEKKPESNQDLAVNPYLDDAYLEHRKASLGIISKSNFFAAIKNNAGMINSALVTTAVAGLALSATMPLWIVGSLIGAAVIFGAFSAYAAYMDERMSKEVGYAFSEARQMADARVIAKENAQELAVALKDTLGEELKEIRKENCQTQNAVVHLQKQMLSWQEREMRKEQAEPKQGVLQ